MLLESHGNDQAGSWAGAKGLMQLIPSTARLTAKSIGMLGYSDSIIMDPETNVELGTAYLRQKVDQYKDFVAAAIAYNAGSIHPCPQECTSWCVPDDPKSAKPPFPGCKQQSDCAAGTCREKSSFGARSDGNPYGLWVIQSLNAALDNGYPLVGPLPDMDHLPPVVIPHRPIIRDLSPFAGVLLAALGAYAGYWLTQQSMRPRSRARRGYRTLKRAFT